MAAASLQARLVGTGDVRLPRLDYTLLGCALALALLGLVMVASASITMADRELGHPFYYALRQGVFIGLGLLAGLTLFRVRLVLLDRMGMTLLLGAFLLLLLVLVPGVGVKVNGAVRWINAGLFRLQVSEPAKLLFIIYLASYLARHGESVRNQVSGFLKPVGLLLAMAVLLLLEPDFGATVVLGATVMGMIFMAGVKLAQFSGMLGLAGLLLGGVAVSSSYRMERLKTFLNPWADPFDSGFQLTQSLMAIGRGEWFGVGLGASVQKLFYLPEAHTDFVFAVTAEELGLLGVCVIIALYSVLVWRAFRIAAQAGQAENLFAASLAYGIGIWFGLQSFINIGVNMGLLPTKGLTLPLMSYGGSSMIVMCAAVALLLRIDYETRCTCEGLSASGTAAAKRNRRVVA
ncbi:MAG TPA: putative lipid II flippase FtsW [Gammaproteobacteria bacterium]|nr:putative lipid II flippase FtsW [Gammaproteobacteria bacterium]